MKNNLMMMMFAVAVLFTACSKDLISEAALVGNYTGTASCNISVANTDVPINDFPYALSITNPNDGDEELTLNDGAILSSFIVSTTSNGFDGDVSQSFPSLDIGGMTFTNLNISLSATGIIDGSSLDHIIKITGTSDQGTISLNCIGTLTK